MENTHSFGFPPEERLLEKGDFLRMKSKGQKRFGKHFIYVSCQNDQPQARVGCIVTRKTGNAVIRNKWKRTVREFFRNHKDLFETQKDHLWIIKSSIQGKPDRSIKEEMKSLLKKASR